MCAHEEAIRELRRAARALSGACLERMLRVPDRAARADGGLPDAFLKWLEGR